MNLVMRQRTRLAKKYGNWMAQQGMGYFVRDVCRLPTFVVRVVMDNPPLTIDP